MFTIAPPVPPRRVDMRRTASREHRIVPVTLTAKTFVIAALVTSSTRANATGDSRIVHQCFDGTEFVLRCLEHAHDLFFAGDVGLNCNGSSAGSDDFINDPLSLSLARCEVDRNRVSPPTRKCCDGRANSAAGSSDDECP